MTHVLGKQWHAAAQSDGERTVLLSGAAVDQFLAVAAEEYRLITPEQPRPCFGLLLGTFCDEFIVVDVAFGENVRTTHPSACEEFAETIVPKYGSAYENPVRAWWIAPDDLLRISREAEARGLEILGSIHLHPDWHRLGPESERGRPLSERPTPMDEHMFRECGWQVNAVCYLEMLRGAFYYSLAAWDETCAPLPTRVGAFPSIKSENDV
jgi:hypothetical protein